MTVADKVVERGPDGQPGDAEIGAQLAFGRNGCAHLEVLDQGEHSLTRLALLGHVTTEESVSAMVSVARSCSIASRLAPLSGAKKWNCVGSTATCRGRPTFASIRGSRRALKRA